MLIQFKDYLTFENIYIWSNFGVLPFWLLLIIIPNSKITQFFVNSIIAPLILASAYVYVIYQNILLEEPIFEVFQMYFGLDNLYTTFASESFLLVFWLHFLATNLFMGSWISRDSVRYNIPRKITFAPLMLTYLVGPIGLLFYWLFRIFYAKKISLHD